MEPAIAKIKRLIERYQSFVIIMHEQPDGDTIASSLAFQHALCQMGKRAICVSKDPLPKPFRFLANSQDIQSDFLAGDYNVMIVLDCGDLRRTGFPQRVKQFATTKKRVIHIDHHQKSDLYKLANVKLFDETASATGEVLFHLFNSLAITFSVDIATCLLTAIYYDTGAFKHANTTDRVMKVAATLLSHGARLGDITKNVELTKSVAGLKLWGVALARLKRHTSLSLLSSVLTTSDLVSCQAEQSDTAGIVNLINSVPGFKAVILLTDTSDGIIRASLRTENNKVNVARLAELFGGGGLRRASGFAIPGHLVRDKTKWHIHLTET